ncbi:MAG TPA: hypothetical protein DCG75_01740 [Bacteroidales bacterium]|nr:hypothetical protein [Bacteroidales bacterium]
MNEYYKLDSNGVIHGAYVLKCNDTLLAQGYFHKGTPAGKWVFYNINSQKIIEGYYLNGLMNGQWIYYKDNKVISKIGYKLGVLHGEVKSNYLNGNTRIIYNYKNGELDGEVKYFYENGQIKEERFYISGSLDSLFIVYDENYQESIKIIYDNNRPVSILKSKDLDNFPLKIEGNLLDGNGKFKSYFKKSGYKIPLEERNYVNGKLNGNYISYYNGVKVLVGNFENGLMIGKWKHLNQKGEVIEKNEYVKSDNMDFTKIQKYQHNIEELDLTSNYLHPDIAPRFLGQDISNNITVSKDGIKSGTSIINDYLKSEIEKLLIDLKGNIFVQFSIGLCGEVKNVEIIKGFSENENENEQILNIFQKFPIFEPGFIEGFPVNVKFTIVLKPN